MKITMPQIVGNERLRRRLGDDVLSGTLSHAYLLEGPVGSGKHTISRLLAASLACERKHDENTPLPCGECLSCRKILDGKSPDIMIIGREDKATIGVETVRRIREDAHTFPNDLDLKLYIIEDAHTMTAQAQNALLLTLEEPPSFVRFLLLCENTQTILETIKSRAPVLRTEAVDPDRIAEYLCHEVPGALSQRDSAPGEWREILLSCDGCIGRAMQLLDPKVRKPILNRRRLAQEFLDACLTNRERATRMIALFGAVGAKREDVNEFLLTLQTAIRDLTMLKRSDNAPLLFYTDREEAMALSDRIPAATLIRMYENCEDARCAVTIRNANIRLTLMELALRSGMIRT